MQSHKVRLVTKKVFFNQLNTLSGALSVRSIRNECRPYLTNNTNYISIPRQIWWYFTYYLRASRSGTYRIFVARDSKNHPVGYGALHRLDNELLITECVSKTHRSQGFGQAILKKLINIGKHEKLTLTAEIRDTNKISIALHKKYGFRLKGTRQKPGFKLRIYKLKKPFITAKSAVI